MTSNDVEMTLALTQIRQRLVAVVLAIVTICFILVHTDDAATASQSRPVPLLLTGVTGTSLAFVVSATNVDCASRRCLQLQRTNDNGTTFTSLHLPPISDVKGNLGNLGEIIFANSIDGYASIVVGNSLVWYTTTDGARSWHREYVAAGESILQLAPTHNELYTVIAKCVKKNTCTDFRIAHSALTDNKWTIEALPKSLYKGNFALDVYNTNVWLNLQGSQSPLLFTSTDQGRTFSESSTSPLASVSACNLTPMSPNAVWAECPTGMLVSFLYSSDAGAHWISVSKYTYAGTGGGAFDPVSSSLAYLNFGTFTTRGKDLYVITDAGHRMTAVGNLACTSANDLVFSNAARGLTICQTNSTASSSTYLLRTSDGGMSWKKLTLP
jgi:photosystem II stability/assembly factor-like uncharacterized protein